MRIYIYFYYLKMKTNYQYTIYCIIIYTYIDRDGYCKTLLVENKF